MVIKNFHFNFQPDVLCDECLLYNILYFIMPLSLPNPAIFKYLECVCLGYFYTFYSWPFLDKTRNYLEEKI